MSQNPSEPPPKPTISETMAQLQTTPQGLTAEEAQKRIQQWGPNALKETRVSPVMRFLHYLWGPISM